MLIQFQESPPPAPVWAPAGKVSSTHTVGLEIEVVEELVLVPEPEEVLLVLLPELVVLVLLPELDVLVFEPLVGMLVIVVNDFPARSQVAWPP